MILQLKIVANYLYVLYTNYIPVCGKSFIYLIMGIYFLYMTEGMMEFRLAVIDDLPQLKKVYKDIVKNMNEQNIEIWDDIYPFSLFEDDIRKEQLYVLTCKDEIVSAFALTKTNKGETSVEWRSKNDKVYYLDRLGVNINYSKKGIGCLMLNKAKVISKNLGANYLRLFVVDINEPAISLYIKNGFKRVKGMYEERFDDGFVLYEFGYEFRL